MRGSLDSSDFCSELGLKTSHSVPYVPQTLGLERVFSERVSARLEARVAHRRDNHRQNGQGTTDGGAVRTCIYHNLNLKWRRILATTGPFFLLVDFAGAWNTSRVRSVFRIGRSALSLTQTNESACGRKRKNKSIKLRLNLPPFRSEAARFSFSLRPFRCWYLLNGRTRINYFPLCQRALDASSK